MPGPADVRPVRFGRCTPCYVVAVGVAGAAVGAVARSRRPATRRPRAGPPRSAAGPSGRPAGPSGRADGGRRPDGDGRRRTRAGAPDDRSTPPSAPDVTVGRDADAAGRRRRPGESGRRRHLLPSGHSTARTVGPPWSPACCGPPPPHHFGAASPGRPVPGLPGPGRRGVGDRPLPPAGAPAAALRRPRPHRPAAGDRVGGRPHLARTWSGAAIGGAVAFVVFFAHLVRRPRGMGFGDVRLAGVIGSPSATWASSTPTWPSWPAS